MHIQRTLLSLAVLLTCLARHNCQTLVKGKCPDPKVQENFNITKYLGAWYEIERFFDPFEIGQNCVTANYSIKTDGHVQVLNTGQTAGETITAAGDAYASDPKEPAKLSVQFANGIPYVPYWVISTDYTGYALVYTCENIIGGLYHTQFAWILSRQKTLNEQTISTLKSQLSAVDIEVSYFNKVSQNNCNSQQVNR